MIVLRRLDGSRLGINEDQIERLDETPDTVVTLVNGNSYLVTESIDEVVERVAEFKARTHGAPRAAVRGRSRGRLSHLQLAESGTDSSDNEVDDETRSEDR